MEVSIIEHEMALIEQLCDEVDLNGYMTIGASQTSASDSPPTSGVFKVMPIALTGQACPLPLGPAGCLLGYANIQVNDATAIEYGLIAAGIALAIITGAEQGKVLSH